MHTVSDTITEIGKGAGVKVSEKANRRNVKGEAKVKYASAHDLRRAFGARWSTRVMPKVLQQLMRHESITTTLQFYAGKNAEAAADAVFDAVANTFANNRPQATETAGETTTQPIDGTARYAK